MSKIANRQASLLIILKRPAIFFHKNWEKRPVFRFSLKSAKNNADMGSFVLSEKSGWLQYQS